MIPVDAVIFDLDGTLVDSRPGIVWALEHAVREVLELETEGLSWSIGPPLAQMIEVALPDVEEHRRQDVARAFRELYDSEGWLRTEPMPGIATALETLQSAGFALYVVTNKRSRPTTAILGLPGLRGRFIEAVCLDSRDPPYEDKAQALRALISERNLAVGRTLYVGDTDADGFAAALVGTSFVRVGWGYEPDGPGVDTGSCVVQTVQQLLDIIVPEQ